MEYPTLDAHAPVTPTHSSKDLADSGAVLAMTPSLGEAALGVERKEANVMWGVGCYPRFPKSQAAFDVKRFEELLEKTAVVGAVGLDVGSRVPLDLRLKNFRQILEVVSTTPRLVSIHSNRGEIWLQSSARQEL